MSPAGMTCSREARVDDESSDGWGEYDLVAHLRRQSAWSERTFGPGMRVQGTIRHVEKELREIEAAGGRDLEEWIDVALLAFDGAWRTGATPEQVAAALARKQEKNEARQWPDWRTVPAGQPVEHVRSPSAYRCTECNGEVVILRRTVLDADGPIGEVITYTCRKHGRRSPRTMVTNG